MNAQMNARVLEQRIREVMFSPEAPLMSVYHVCRKLGIQASSSTDKRYARVYRAMERLVEKGELFVARGTRDVSVYLAKSNITSVREIPS